MILMFDFNFYALVFLFYFNGHRFFQRNQHIFQILF